MNKKRTVIYGPPGTGKTYTLKKIVEEYKRKGIPDNKIGMVSYTKTAANVLTRRINLNTDWSGTLHALAFKQAGLIREQIISKQKINEFLEKYNFDVINSKYGENFITLYNYARSINNRNFDKVYKMRQKYLTFAKHQFRFFCRMYEAWKESNGYLDFNDVLELGKASPIPDIDLLFIDEAQDLSRLQWELIDTWSLEIPIIYIAGDDDQAIYGFNGGDFEGMTNFEKEYKAKRIYLNHSHRLPEVIHKKAKKLYPYMGKRVPKLLIPKKTPGEIKIFNHIDKIPNIYGEENILILYRNHTLRNEIEDYLIRKRLPYVIESGAPGLLHTPEAKKAILYTQTRHQIVKHGYEPSKKLLTKLATGMFRKYSAAFNKGKYEDYIHLKWDKVYNFDPLKKHYILNIQEMYGLEKRPTIRLNTMHGAKGEEADTVILLDSMGGLTAENIQDTVHIEARVFYVAMTRTKERLWIVQGENPFLIGKI